jgi:hypothetical protein
MAVRSAKGALKLAAIATVSLAATAGAAQAQQASGDIIPYYGNIVPFYGNIQPFYGNIVPFYGNIQPFYGNIRPFWGDTSEFWGSLQPFAPTKDPNFWGSLPGYTNAQGQYFGGQVGAFWTTEGTVYSNIINAFGTASTPADYANIAQMIQGLVTASSNFWSPEVKKYTHDDFMDGFGSAMLAEYGINLSDPSSLENLTQTQAAEFLLAWYDGLMSYAGAGHVDWWMAATGWTPALAQTEASIIGNNDKPVSIGMLDFTVVNNQKDAEGTVLQYGSTEFGDGHGAAVESLIAGSLDGTNIMGVMPAGTAAITVYDPYDSTGTTNWTAVGTGIDTLTEDYFQKSAGTPGGLLGALQPLLNAVPLVNSLTTVLGGLTKIAPSGSNIGVINASLGEPGWTLAPGWNQALASGSAKYSILVVAAGNDGVVQPSNIQWNFATNPTLLVVGSIGLNGQISNFSNTPGNSCLIDTSSGACDPLKDHYLVAPGELILVSNGEGGISRQTGTSLAAPLVTGAIGLLEARWPWLANYPNETAEIILESATPIYSPGYTGPRPDPVYGWGELNIAASQEPLNWQNLVYFKPGLLGLPTPVPINQVIATVQTGNQAAWNSSKLYFTALERIGNTYRDFEIPMASSLVGQNVATLAGQQMFQSYLTGPLKTWVAGQAGFAAAGYDPATANFVASSVPMGELGDAQLRMRVTDAAPAYGFTQHSVPMNMDFALIGQSQTMQFGFGDGAETLSGQPGLAGNADFQLGRGGANPLLGLASGGAYADWRYSPVQNLTVSFGATDRRSVRDPWMLGALGWAGATNLPGEVYAATAENVGLDYAAGKNVVLHASLTSLRENSGLLGVQSLSGALNDGSTSRSASFGMDLKLSRTLMLSGSATVADTTTGAGQILATAPGGLTSTAAEIAVTKADVFGAQDRVRLTLSKPMQVVAGQLQYTNFGVVDRETGELGDMVETAGVSNKTPFAAELFYGRVVGSNNAEASVFLRASVNTDEFGSVPQNDYMIGYRYKLAF